MASASTDVLFDHPQEMSSRVAPTISYFAAFVALGLTTGLLGPTLPTLAQETRASLGAISYLFTVRSVGYILGSLRVGQLFDGKSGNRILGLMLTLMALSSALVTQAANLWALLLLMLVLGAAEGSLDVGANALLVRVHGWGVGPYMNAMHSFFGVGALIAPLVVARLTLFAYPAVDSYLVVAVLLLPAAGYAFLMAEGDQVQTPKHRAAVRRPNGFVLLFALLLLLYVGAEVGFAGWIFTYVTESELGGPTAGAYLTSLFWGALTAGRVLTIPLAARVMPTRLIVSSIAGGLLSLSLVILAPRSILTLGTATVGFGLSMASIFPSTLTLASHRMRITGRITGWFVTGASLGATLIPLIIGQLLQRVGPQAVIFGTASALLLALIVLKSIVWNRVTEFDRGT